MGKMTDLLHAKRRIVTHFADKSIWQNLIDEELLVERMKRRSRLKTINNITVDSAHDGTFHRIGYSNALPPQQAVLMALMQPANQPKDIKCFVEIRKNEGGTTIIDESGRMITAKTSAHHSDGVNDVNYESAMQEAQARNDVEFVDIPDTDISVMFRRSGEKTVFLHAEKSAMQVDAPTGYAQQPEVFTKFLNRVKMDSNLAQGVGLDIKRTFLDKAKLFVALDLGVEPDIKLFNKLDNDKGFELLAYLIERQNMGQTIDPESADYDIGLLQQAWHDSIDFEGYYIGVSRMFGIQITAQGDGYFNFDFSADSKEFLIAQGMVLDAVLASDVTPSQMLQKNPTIQNLMHVLDATGQTFNGHYERDVQWRFVVLESNKAAGMARQARQMFIDHFDNDFARNFVSTLRYDDNRYLVAVREDAFVAANAVMKASTQALGMIKNDSGDAVLFAELIGAGASFKYVSPDEAKKGNSFSALLRQSGNTVLLDALRSQIDNDIVLQGLDL